MKHLPTVATTMTPFPHVIDVNASLQQASHMMVEHGFHHLPVTDDGAVVGLLSEEDIRRIKAPVTGISDISELQVKDICCMQILVVDIHDRLDLVLALMAERHLQAAIVMRNDKLAGILTTSDALRKFAELLESLRPTNGGGDAA